MALADRLLWITICTNIDDGRRRFFIDAFDGTQLVPRCLHDGRRIAEPVEQTSASERSDTLHHRQEDSVPQFFGEWRCHGEIQRGGGTVPAVGRPQGESSMAANVMASTTQLAQASGAAIQSRIAITVPQKYGNRR